MMGNFFTHPSKILFPESGITKQDLVNYYIAIHEWILPYILYRPLTLVRCTNGIREKCFYQKHIQTITDENIHAIDIREKESTQTWMYITGAEGLMSLIQIDTLEIHCWGSTIDNIEKPDMIIFDLDPDISLIWSQVISGAMLIKNQLGKIGLKSFIKTSGGKGLHVMLPILPDWNWDNIKNFSHAFSKLMEDHYPDIFITNMSKAKRKGKIFLDYLRNGRGATVVAPYSIRARPYAPVSMPLDWKELKPSINSCFYHIYNTPKRLTHLKNDPWREFLTLEQTLNI
jgi:bifunctional non-homologous end joining protein LigD